MFIEVKKAIKSLTSSSSTSEKSSSVWNRQHFRLCHLHRKADETYGFTICAYESNGLNSHIISKVNPNSSASMSGILVHDRLIEVNGCNVEHENANQIENRVRTGLRVGCVESSNLSNRVSYSAKCYESPESLDSCHNPTKVVPLNNIINSVSSNDSGLVTDELCPKTSASYENDINKNECLLLVLDPKSYEAYIQERAKFLSTAPVVYMKSSVHDDDFNDLQSLKASARNITSHSLDEGSLLTSSNDSFDYMESQIDNTSDDALDLKDELSTHNFDTPNSIIQTDVMQLPFDDSLSPRLCYLKKKNTVVGYGFNLISPRGSKIQTIGKVESNSPAGMSGLRNDDIVIEVNGMSILNENHREVVTRITEGVIRNGRRYKDEVVLLVVTPEAKRWYDSREITINYRLPNIMIIGDESIKLNQLSDQPAIESGSMHTVENTFPSVDAEVITNIPIEKPLCKASIEVNLSGIDNRKCNSASQMRDNKLIPFTISSRFADDISRKDNNLNLDMSVAEMRELLKLRNGKRSIINQCNKLSLQEKYKIVKNM
ncbi:hypothetical protein GJ496_005391 [Pomphorhynchus laevis]|nr:hypothetical protein GJ496_005391 [Pomphorhynchus laevis]